MKADDLNFMGSDPGAVKNGNFINYYSFHGVKERIENLHPQMFPTASDDTIYCLDIGCNTGELSKELYTYLENFYTNCSIHMLAIDIDPTLIHRAQENNTQANITYSTVDIMTASGRETIMNYLNSRNINNFNITFCFSVTMWIHLNNGDEGLQEFINFLKQISKTVIIEPQPWNCYRNAQRRIKKAGSNFPLYETLQIRSNVDSVIESFLDQSSHKKIYESSNSSWKRKVQSYQLK